MVDEYTCKEGQERPCRNRDLCSYVMHEGRRVDGVMRWFPAPGFAPGWLQRSLSNSDNKEARGSMGTLYEWYMSYDKGHLAQLLISERDQVRELTGVIERLKDERRASETAAPKVDPRQYDLFTKLEA